MVGAVINLKVTTSSSLFTDDVMVRMETTLTDGRQCCLSGRHGPMCRAPGTVMRLERDGRWTVVRDVETQAWLTEWREHLGRLLGTSLGLWPERGYETRRAQTIKIDGVDLTEHVGEVHFEREDLRRPREGGWPTPPCREMSTRSCPPDNCDGLPCARFESDDVSRWPAAISGGNSSGTVGS